MSDSEDEFLSRKKQCQPLIDSEDDENDEKPSETSRLSSSQTSDCNARADAVLPANSLNGEKCDQLPAAGHSNCASDNESRTSQSSNKVRSQSSLPDGSSQSSINRSSSVSSVKRKSSSNSDSSDSGSRSTIISNRSSSQHSTKRLSPDPQASSQSSNTTLVSNEKLNNTKSSVTSSESDSCSEAESKPHDTSVNSTERGSFLPKYHSDNVSDSETTKPKAKKYKLLSDNDLSEDEENHVAIKHYDSGSGGGNQNHYSSERLKLKKEKRKMKLQMLNKLKRKELKEKSGNESSDSESEKNGMFDVSNDRHFDSSRVSSDNSAASDSESEKAKSKTKSDRKSLPQRKSKKIDPKLEIKSKTQKMIRENRISLPYHQPKKRSLDEFLARRKNTPSIPLKATDDVLHVVSEHLLKREKEVKVFYKSESDHSDDGGENVSTVDETVNESTRELQNQENSSEKSMVPVNNADSSLGNDDFVTELENSVEIQENSKSTNNAPVDVSNCDQDPSKNITGMVSGNCESSTMDLDVFSEKESEEFSDQLINVEPRVTLNEVVSEVTNTDFVKPDETNTTESNSPLPQENNLTEVTKVVEENPELNSISALPGIESASKQNTFRSDEEMSANVEHSSKENEAKESVESVSKEPEESTEPPDTDDFDLMIQDSSVSKQPEQNNAEPPDTDDFDLMIQDSCNDTEEGKIDSETVTPKSATDLRNKKLALFSRLKIPLRADIKLQPSPDTVIELETPTISESEFGVYELKKKFEFHSSLRNKPIRKTSTKLSILRTETDSQGEIINVVKETIDISCGEVKEDEEKEKFSIPGAKHTNFKEHMLKSLIEKKKAKWQEYQEEKRKLRGRSSDEEEFDEECSEKSDFEPYHPEDELDDDELEENDIEMEEKRTKRNDFVDDEAEVSFDEDENLKESDVEDEESEKETEAEETAVEGDHESADDEADVEADDKDEDEDSDAEMLSTKKELAESSQPSQEVFKKPSQLFPLFKYNTTGADLENKVLGFENIFDEKSKCEVVTSSQLFEICSGKFATQVEKLNSSDPSDSEFFVDSQHGEDSQNINLSLQDTNDGFNASETRISDNRSFLFSSDESDTEELFARKKKQMRLDDSDDETNVLAPLDDDKSDVEKNDNNIDDAVDEDVVEPNDEEDADELDAFGDDDDVEEELAYNSEEEIITKQKATEFFENEAELSESEWGSEDENEQNLDDLEKEAGDDDVLDEDELKKELGKIHMRQLLDDDQKDVRMLKEMLFEDGDLHSDGKRQRKFQWTNLDDNGFFSKMANDSDEEEVNEEDEEELDINWRKIRHEREMFISQQEKRENLLEEAEAEDETNDSLLLPKTNASDVPAKSNKPNVATNNNISSPDLKLPFKARFKCGSFLTRSKILLDRIAVTVGECKENVTGKAKNHRNFVFAAVSPEKELPNVPETKTEKRKISSKSVMARKKLKLAPTNERGLLAQLALRE